MKDLGVNELTMSNAKPEILLAVLTDLTNDIIPIEVSAELEKYIEDQSASLSDATIKYVRSNKDWINKRALLVESMTPSQGKKAF